MPQSAELIRLSDLPPSTPACLTKIQGGHHLMRRLLSLGLRQGSHLSVVQRRGQGLVLASGEVRIAVGTGIADKLWVTPCATPEDSPPPDGTDTPETAVRARPAWGDEG